MGVGLRCKAALSLVVAFACGAAQAEYLAVAVGKKAKVPLPKSNRVWLNLGTAVVSVGDVLTVVSKGEELIDPETGLSLGSMDTSIGDIRVTEVQEKFSVAEIVSIDGEVNRGDKVVSTAQPPRIDFAEQWQKPKRGQF